MSYGIYVPEFNQTQALKVLHPDDLKTTISTGIQVMDALLSDLRGLGTDGTALMWRYHGDALKGLVQEAIQLYSERSATKPDLQRWSTALERIDLRLGRSRPELWGNDSSIPDWWHWTRPDIHADYRQLLLVERYGFYCSKFWEDKLVRPSEHRDRIIHWPAVVVQEALRGKPTGVKVVRCGEYLYAGSTAEILESIQAQALGLSQLEWLKRIGFPLGEFPMTPHSIFNWMVHQEILVEVTKFGR